METMPHELTLRSREKLTLTGVTEVLRFEDSAVVLATEQGTLIIQGDGLKLRDLSLEGGKAAVDGHITALTYQEPREGGGWLSRLLG